VAISPNIPLSIGPFPTFQTVRARLRFSSKMKTQPDGSREEEYDHYRSWDGGSFAKKGQENPARESKVLHCSHQYQTNYRRLF